MTTYIPRQHRRSPRFRGSGRSSPAEIAIALPLIAALIARTAPLLDDADFEVALFAKHRDADVEGMLLEQKIHLAERQLQIQQAQIGEEWWENRAVDAQAAIGGVGGQTQARLDQMED